MTTLLFPVGNGLQNLGLSVIIGGLLALGAFTAPVLFKHFARPEAGDAMTLIFRRYDMVLLIGLGLILGGELLRIIPTGLPPLLSFPVIVRYVILAALGGMVLYSTLVLNPKIEALQDQPDFRSNLEVREQFNRVHKLSEKLAKMELLAGVILLMLTPFVQPSKLN